MISPRVVYTRHYNIRAFGLERLHPFDSRKYGRAYRALKHRLGRAAIRRRTLKPTGPASREQLLWFHSPEYLDEQLRTSTYLANALEIGPLRRLPAPLIDLLILRPMRWAVAGTILAAREAKNCRLIFNLSGGYHHASAARGEGFCIYNDIALAVEALRRDGTLGEQEKVVYIDCDAHQGNGVCHAFFNDSRMLIYDIYNKAIYPVFDVKARRRVDCDVPLAVNRTDADYLSALQSTLPGFLDAVTRAGAVKLAIYNAGTDIFRDDPLGALAVTANGVLERDRFVIEQLLARSLPAVVLPSGGYTHQSYRLIANMIEFALTRWASA